MNIGADVRSLSQLHLLRDRIARSRVETLKETESLQAELSKLTRWLEDEATAYWQQQLTQSERALSECREALMRCQATVRVDEQRPCTDERKRLERAIARKALCDSKLRAAHQAKVVWQKQVVKLRGRLQHTADLAEGNLMVTLQKLDAIITTLQTYAQVHISGPEPTPP
jgi:hypothetical protein